jgi:hypothetical protein
MTMILFLAMQLTTASEGITMLKACTDPALAKQCAEYRVLQAKVEGLKEVMAANAQTREALAVAREAIATANYWRAEAQRCQDAKAEVGRPSIDLKPWCDSIGAMYNTKTGWCVAPKGVK